MKIFKWNSMVNSFVMRIRRLSSNLGPCWLIFSRVMPLWHKKIPIIFTFRSLSPLQIDVFNWNMVYRCVTRIRSLSSNFGCSRRIFGRVMPLGLEIPIIFSFRSFLITITNEIQCTINVSPEYAGSEFEFCYGWILLGRVLPLGLKKLN